MTRGTRRRVVDVLAILLLILVTVQLWIVFSGWSGSSRDVFQLVVALAQLTLALTILTTSLRIRRRNGSETAPPEDDSQPE